MKVLTLSDVVVDVIYSPNLRSRFSQVDFAVGCGDLPYYYLEYIVSVLDIPVFYVRGNHGKVVEYGESGPRKRPLGAIDLHRNVIYQEGIILAGVQGCLRYKDGPFQYTQFEMWLNVFRLVPALIYNQLVHGRYLDIFVSHAAPWGIHDQSDLAHQGIKAFRWLLHTFRPHYHFHGHVHLYNPNTVRETVFEYTTIINTYGYREIELDIPPGSRILKP